MAGTTDREQESDRATSLADEMTRDRANEVTENVRSIAKEILDGHYGDGFSAVTEVRREESMADDEHDTYLDITIAFDAEDPRDCEPEWLVAFLTELRMALVKVGIEEFPVPSYLLKSEWEQVKEGRGSVQAR